VARRGLCPGCKLLCPGCAPADKSSSFHSAIQHEFFASHSTILHSNRRQDFESNFFKNFPWVTHPDPFCGRPILHPSPVQPSPVRGTQAPQCWDPEVTGPHPAPVRTNSWRRHCLRDRFVHSSYLSGALCQSVKRRTVEEVSCVARRRADKAAVKYIRQCTVL